MKIVNKIACVIAIICLSLTTTNAQDYTFKVLGSKGSNKLDGAPLRIGTRIKQAQTIVVGPGAYLGLAHKTGKTIELKKSGTYKVTELEKKISGGGSSLAGKYAQFIMDELLSGTSGGRFNKKIKTGSVTRETFGNTDLQVMMPKKAEIIDKAITLKWYLKEDLGQDLTYNVKIEDLFGNALLNQNVTETQITLDLSEDKFKKSPALTYIITAVENAKVNSGEHALHKVKKPMKSQIEEELGSLNTDDTALGNLILARFYEDKELLAHAINAYEKALKVSDLEQYRHLYKSFLDRNYLSKESRDELAEEEE